MTAVNHLISEVPRNYLSWSPDYTTNVQFARSASLYLGGNSLLGAQVIARVRDTFNIELPLLSLFNSPTVAELSAEIEQLLVAKLEVMSEDEALQLAAPSSNARQEMNS
ncbi:MAG: Peptide synthetase [Acidobacteriaceae bacterium]|nr:Peptide synthetase [Acidobacteriaceae bacterium]